MRRPGISLAAAVAVLVAAAIPLTSITSGFAGISTLPDSFASKQGFAVLDEELGFGETAPADIVIDGDVHAEPVSAAIERLTERHLGRRRVRAAERARHERGGRSRPC